MQAFPVLRIKQNKMVGFIFKFVFQCIMSPPLSKKEEVTEENKFY